MDESKQTESKGTEGIKATVLNRNNLALHKLCEKDRYYLNGIHVTDDYTEVTNGHYLVRVSTIRQDIDDMPNDLNGNGPTIKQVETIIKAEDAKDIEGTLPKVGYPAVDQKAWFINQDDEKLNIGAFEKSWTIAPLDGRFPRVDNIWPAKQGKEAQSIIRFNLEYMERLCAFMKKALKSKHCNPNVKLTIYNENTAMELTAEDSDTGQTIEALLMPCKL